MYSIRKILMQKNFSYPLIVDDIASAEKKYKLTATPEELTELTEILKVPAVKSFSAEIYTKMNKKAHMLDVWGQVSAELELQSVISLEYFTKSYTPEFSLVFDTKATLKSQKEEEIEINGDLPDIVIGGQIDLAQIAIEQLALVLEDYPRREGEVFQWKSEFDEADDAVQNPFKILEKLKK